MKILWFLGAVAFGVVFTLIDWFITGNLLIEQGVIVVLMVLLIISHWVRWFE